MEPLIMMPRNDWPKLQDLYRNYWPQGAEGYRLLDIQIQYPDMNRAFNFNVYCPDGNVNNGMVAISDKEHFYQLYIYPISEDTSAIENALINSKVIDWNRNVCAPSVSTEALVCLKRVAKSLMLQITENKVCKHLLNRDSKREDIADAPPNTYVAPLKPEHLDLIDRTWTFYTPDHSKQFFEVLTRNGLSYVLYSKLDHEPLAWIFIDEAGAFTHLYCLETHRRKGYAEYITKIATYDLLKQGKDILAYTLQDNVRPQKLFNKLGFDFLGTVTWMFLNKKT
ncbi:hypothetical protein evm_007622 [Chilo suppressalis]|nr:hypothetical protein evm_007622 [Chilo suppressalis]